MALTTFESNNALTKKVYEEILHKSAIIDSYWSKFMSSGTESIVHVKDNLVGKKGDDITYGLVDPLAGDGVVDDQILEGNEEALESHDSSVTLHHYRHAVMDKGALHRQRPVLSIDDEQKSALQRWATEKIDKLCFNAALANPTKILYRASADGKFTGTASAATAKAAMSATNGLLTPNFLLAAKVWAMTGGNRAYTPIRPVKVDGEDFHVMLVSPNVLYALESNSDFQTAQREAQARGKDNPLFKNAKAIWKNVVVHAHERIPEYTDGGGASVRYATCILLGAQALTYARCKSQPLIRGKRDWDNQWGWAWGEIMGVAKPVFDSKDYGSVGIYLAINENVSGA